MADNTIDTLDIQISSSTEKAVRALTNLSNKLTEVNSALGGVNTNGLRSCVRELGKLKELDIGKMTSIAVGIGKFSNSIKTMGGVDYKGSGLNAVINSINRLSQVDVSGFDSGKLGEIIHQLSNLTEIPDVSTSVNRFVNSMARLANSGEYIANVSAELPGLGRNLKSIVESFTSVGDISEPVNRLVQSIAQLASSGNKIGQTSSQLGTLAKEVLSFFDVMKTAPKISDNTIRMTEALAKLANSGGKVNSATNSISSAFSKLSSATSNLGNIVSKTSSKIGTGIKSIIGWFQHLGNSSSGVKTASFNLGNLLKTAIGFKAIRGLANLGKSAIGFGSDITEIENVVDVSFGSMADEAYKFASTAKEQFGLSELAAKQYSGTMMAMMKSSGVAQDAASKMSISLAGLAGDIASFYNIDTDTAFQKIRSGISGEIEPLRQLGINLSVANMEAYALSRGITTSYNAMSQAEKVALRYNYLMSVTGDVQGDFVRTSGTWANQVRLLTLNFQSLSAVIGQGLIAGILPAIQALNALMSKLMQAANVFRNFMYVLMGKKLKGSQSGVSDIVSNLGGIETAGDDASSGLDDATSSAKKLKKALSVLPFDQLNQLTDNSDNSGTASKSLGSGLGDLADSFSGIQDSLDEVLTVDETPINKWAAKIRKAFINKDWKGLGFTIADMINVGMQKIYEVINWNNVGPKITEFVNAFTTAFNSMVSGIDFDLMGRLLGAGINTAVNTLNLLLGDGGIDFSGIGAKLSQLLKGAINEIDWTGLGNLIGNSFMASWKMLSGFVKDMSKKDGAGITGWGKLGTAIGKALNGAIKKIDMNTIADALSGLLNGAFESLKAFTETFNWYDLATKIRDGIAKFIKETNWKENGQALGDFISHLCTALKDSLTTDTFYEFGQGVGTFLGELPWGEILSTAADLLLTGLTSALNGLFDGLEEKHPIAGHIAEWLTKAFIAVKIANITGIGTLVGSLVGHIAGKIAEKKNAEMIAEKLADVLGDGTSGAKEAIKDLGDAAESAGNGGFTTLAEKIKNLGDVAQTAGGQFQGFWGYATNLGATAFVMEGLGQVKKAMDFKDSTADAFSDFEVVRKALKTLEDQTGISGDKLIGLGGDLKNVKDNAFDFDGQLQTVETSLENLGISSDTFKQALKQAMEESDTSTNSHVSNINEYIGTMGTEFDNAKSALERLSNQAVITPTQFDELSAVLQQQESSGATARAAFQALMDKMAEMGIDTGKVIKAFSEDVPKSSSTMSKSVETATKSISSNSKTGFGIASAAVSTAMAGMKKSTESTMPSIWSKIKNTNDDVETNSKTNWGNSASAVSTALGTMDTDTKDVMGKVMTTIQSYWSSVLINTNQIWEKASGKVDTETGKMLTYAENNMSSVARVFSSIRKTINGNFSGLYSVGLNAMNDFKRGIESVDIKTPHLQMNYTNWQEGNTHKWRWNSNVEWYAKGGLFNGAQVIGIGENGSEAVLPLENPRTMKKIADSIVSSSDGSMGLTKEEMTKAVAQGVAMAMSMNSGNKNPQYIMNSIILDGSEIAKAVTKAQNETNSRFNPSPAY
jgi:DNA repair ATPase RecN